MTTDYTSAILSPQTKAAASEKLSFKTASSSSNDGVFDSILDKAAKPYTDKDSSKNTNRYDSTDYAKNTKEINNKKEDTKKVSSTDEQKSEKTEDKKTQNKNDLNENAETHQTEQKAPVDNESKAQEETNPVQDEKPQDLTQNKETQESVQKNDSETNNEADSDSNEENTDEKKADTTQNVIANELILANIAFAADNSVDTDTAPAAQSTSSAVQTSQLAKQQNVSQGIIDSVVKNAVEAVPTASENTQTPITQETPDLAAVNNGLEVDVETGNTQKTAVNTPSTKETLAADTSRITVNLENAETVDDTPAVTPTDTSAETIDSAEPLIRVTDEAAAQVNKEASRAVENKDFAGKIKDKATAKMGELQGTSTVVTEVQNSTHSESKSSSNQNNSSLSKGNAAEQAVKLSVENVVDTNTTTAESFMGKLDSAINASAKTGNTQSPMLNKSDIMSQMNAKFNEMQQAGSNKVSIVLQPENLGKVSIEIMNSKDGIVAKMTTDNQQVKELFDKSVEALKSNLSSQGINVNNIKVECTNQTANNAMDFERQQFSQNFSDSNHQNQANHSQNTETIYTSEYGASDDTYDDAGNIEIKNTNTTIRHNGKVDYKV